MAAQKKSATGDQKGSKKSGAGNSGSKMQGGLAKEVKPDSTLAAVIGADSVTRARLTQKIWDYVRKNNLQDKDDRRMINADAKLKPVFGGKSQVSMFEMTKLVNQHVS